MVYRRALAGGWLLCVLALALWSGPLWADTNTSLGDRSGEGSTPFTGLAQTPEANLFTGASGTSIKIEVPPGRKNVTPKLVLQYSSSGGPSLYGYGWDLPLGRIQRSTKWGVPRACGNSCSLTGNACGSSSDCPGESCIATDQFVLVLPSGAVELLAVSPGSNTYRPKTEESYTQVIKDPVNNTWTAYDRSGLKYIFGDVASARTGTDTSVFGQMQNGSCHFTTEWGLTQVQDVLHSNYMSITYNNWYGVLYPASVDYGGNLNTPLSHFYHVLFTWQGRPDFIENDLSGARAVMADRIYTIKVTTDVPTANTPVRTYTFGYDAAPNGQSGYRSILSQVQVSDGQTPPHTVPPQTFAHATSNAGLHSTQSVTAPAGITALRVVDTSQDVTQSLLDMNRDGIADIVKSNYRSAWTVYTKTSSGFSSAWTWSIPSSGYGHFGADEFNFVRDVEVSTGSCSTNGNNFTHCTDRDTMDLNGDGIPDFIDASGWPWVVYFGQLQPNPTPGGTLGSFSPGVYWQIPASIQYPYLRVDKGTNTPSLYEWSSNAVQDLIDMNGDGLPDLVVAGTTTWYVYLNTGHGFQTTPISFPSPNNATSLDSGWGYVDSNGNALETWSTLGMMDMNGDGLPDVVINTPTDYQCNGGVCQATDSDLNVYYNTGAGFTSSPVAYVIPPDWGFRYSYQGQTYHDIVDINGDGLPDWVGTGPDGSGNTSQWYALLNLGGSFAPLQGTEQVVDWVPCGYYQCPVVFTVNVAGPNQTWAGGSGALRQTTVTGNPQYTLIDLFDINGDGMLDRVNTNNSTNWSVQVNQNSTRPNLMVALRNGFGGSTTLTYAPSSASNNTGGDGVSDLPFITWLTTGIVQNDGLCAPPCGGHDLTAAYLYQDGRYDSASREFRGFRYVFPVSADNNWTVTTFGQDAISKGKVLEVDTYAGAYPNLQWVRTQKNIWSYASLANTRSTQLWLGENDTFTCDQLTTSTCDANVPNAQIHYDINFAPDPYGNITHTYSQGVGGADRVDTYVEYATPYLSPVNDKPKHTWSVHNGVTFAEKWFYYDSAQYGTVVWGNLTSVETWLDTSGAALPPTCLQNSGKRCVTSTMGYDSYGNITDAYDANNNRTTTVYDSAKWLYPYQDIKYRYVGDANPLTTTTTTDYKWGKPTQINDVNNIPTYYTYDTFGRLSQVKRPLEDQTYSTQYTYTYGAPGQLSRVQVQQREPNQAGSSYGQTPGYLTTSEYFDGLGRHRHTATLRVVDGGDQQVITGRTQYDVGGRVSDVDEPYVWSGDPAAPPAGTNGTTSYRYWLNWSFWIDPLGRLQCLFKPDGNHTCTLYYGVQRQDADEEWNWAYTTFDTHGRVTRKDWNHGYSNLYTYTTYGYDDAGRLHTTTQNGNNNTTITITYDSLGRKIQLQDPDTGPGVWTYAYDGAGNLIYEDDPKSSQHVQFCYDGLKRVTRKYTWVGSTDAYQSGVDCSFPTTCAIPTGNESVRYVYDYGSYGLGRLYCVADVDPQDSTNNGMTGFGYDARGRTYITFKTITVSNVSKFAVTYFSYDLGDHVQTTTYPDNEAVTTCYNNAGQACALGTNLACNTSTYPNCTNTASATYASALKYDVFGRADFLTHSNGVSDHRDYSATGHRLSHLWTEGSGTTFLDLSYGSYTPRGAVGLLTDNRDTSGVLSNTAQFSYDLGRLVSVTNSPNLTATYSYDQLGNILTKEGTTFGYSTTQPHTLTTINGSTAGIPSPDANGNRAGKPGQLYTYTPDDRVRQIGVGTQTVQLVYDYTGQRMAKVVGSSVTRYYSQLAEVTDSWLTKYYYAGGIMVASQRVAAGQLAMLPDMPAVQVAALPGHVPTLVVLLRGDAQKGLLLAVGLIGTGLLLAPWRRKRVVGIAIRHGHVIGVVFLFTLSSLPLPILFAPATAQAATPTPTRTPTPTTTPPGGTGATGVLHYHFDHLGSTEVITKADRSILTQIRYKPYGEERYRVVDECNGDNYCREFTQYDTEPISGLEYAGARFYDPTLGQFLTHDPARQFANPYAYGPWDPINGTDPTGAAFGIDDALYWGGIFLLAAGVVAAGVQAGIQTGSPLAGFNAALTSAAMAGVSAVGLNVVMYGVGFAAGVAGQQALSAALVGMGAYNTYQGFKNGDYVSAGLGVVSTAVGAYGLAKGIGAQPAEAETVLAKAQKTGAGGEDGGNITNGEARTLGSANDQVGPGPWGPGYTFGTPGQAADDGILSARIAERGDVGITLERGADIRPAVEGGYYYDTLQVGTNGGVNVTIHPDAVGWFHTHTLGGSAVFENRLLSPGDWSAIKGDVLHRPAYLGGTDGAIRMFTYGGPRLGNQLQPPGYAMPWH